MIEIEGAAPETPAENPEMLLFTSDSDFEGIEFRSFSRKPQLIAATLVDQPFFVEGEEFAAGDYLCINEFGVFGLSAETFADLYHAADRHYLDTFRAFHNGSGTIFLEPVDELP